MSIATEVGQTEAEEIGKRLTEYLVQEMCGGHFCTDATDA